MKGLFPVLMLMVAAGQIQAAQQKTVTWSRQATGEQRLEVNVSYGAGELTLGRADSDLLYHARFDYDEDFVTPSVDYAGGRLDVGISSHNNRGFKGRSASSSLDLRLSRDVPMDLNLDFGAGSARLNLSGLPLRGLEVNTGASESEIRVDEVNPERLESASVNVGAAELSLHGIGNLNADRVTVKAGLGSVTLGLDGQWPRDARVTVGMGLGALTIRVPESLGVLIRRENFLTSINAEGFTRNGRSYRSANWETADRRVEVDISAALGAIEIVRIP